MHRGHAFLTPQIRTLTNEDADAWLRLRLEGLRGEPFSFSKSPEEQKPISLDRADGFTLGAFDGAALIGIASFIREPNAKERHKGHVLGVYVTPRSRGRGLGEALMSALIAKAKQDPTLEQIVLAVSTASDAAGRLYLRCGFSIWGREPRAIRVDAQYMDVNHMILPVRPTSLPS